MIKLPSCPSTLEKLATSANGIEVMFPRIHANKMKQRVNVEHPFTIMVIE